MSDIPSSWDNRPPPKLNPRRWALYRPDHKSLDQWAVSDQLRDPVEKVAEAIKAEAALRTPLGDGRPHMRSRYKVNPRAGVIKVHRAVRLFVEVSNDDPESALVEFGSVHNKRRRMLGTAGAKFGDYKPESDTPR